MGLTTHDMRVDPELWVCGHASAEFNSMRFARASSVLSSGDFRVWISIKRRSHGYTEKSFCTDVTIDYFLENAKAWLYQTSPVMKASVQGFCTVSAGFLYRHTWRNFPRHIIGPRGCVGLTQLVECCSKTPLFMLVGELRWGRGRCKMALTVEKIAKVWKLYWRFN